MRWTFRMQPSFRKILFFFLNFFMRNRSTVTINLRLLSPIFSLLNLIFDLGVSTLKSRRISESIWSKNMVKWRIKIFGCKWPTFKNLFLITEISFWFIATQFTFFLIFIEILEFSLECYFTVRNRPLFWKHLI